MKALPIFLILVGCGGGSAGPHRLTTGTYTVTSTIDATSCGQAKPEFGGMNPILLEVTQTEVDWTPPGNYGVRLDRNADHISAPQFDWNTTLTLSFDGEILDDNHIVMHIEEIHRDRSTSCTMKITDELLFSHP